MPSASDGLNATEAPKGVSDSLLSSLRQQLEARRSVLGVGNSRASAARAQEQLQSTVDEDPDDDDDQDLLLSGPVSNVRSNEQQLLQLHGQDGSDRQEGQMLLLDLVSFDHCQELVQVPPAVEQQVLMQFDVGSWFHPLPSQPRQQADQLQRLPQESLGLWVPPHPRISSSSLYKLEQRLAKGRTLDVQRIVQALQEQFPESRQPAVEQATALGPGGLWLDENGLMMYEPSPAKPNKERPWRRYDQDAASTATRWVPASAAPLHLLTSSGASYRLDVELGRLEFEVHPYMALEQQLAAQLLCSFREYHRRASFGLCAYYGQKLAAYEDALLNVREALFSVHQGPTQQDQQQQEDQLLKLLAAVTEAERDVAEVRQLHEEEEALLLAAVQGMGDLWRKLQDVRQLQGGRQLTDVAFSVVQLPPTDGSEVPIQADGLTRQQLDIALLVAEAEQIAGMPAYPAPFPVHPSDAELSSFKLRRVECMASSHAVTRAELLDRLQLLEERVSADPDDPEIQELRQQLQLLGPAPSRQALSHQQEMELWNWAEQEVAAGRAGVHRPPRLQPCLSVLPAAEAAPGHTRTAPLSNTLGVGAPAGAVGSISSVQGSDTRLHTPNGIIRSRLSQSATQQQQQQELKAGNQGQVPGLAPGQQLQVQAYGARLPAKMLYYVRLLVNGRVVGTSEALQLRDDFTLSFRDVFSIRLLKWPDSMQLELWEKGTFRDSLVTEFYLAVPGLGGTPHVDPQAKPYSWTSGKPVPHNRLLQAVASLQPLGVLPAAQAIRHPAGQQQQQQQLAVRATGGSSSADTNSPNSNARAAAVLESVETGGPGSPEANPSSSAHASEVSGLSTSSSSNSSSSFAAMYPSGRLFVRCGWVADSGLEQHFTPFQHTDGAFTLGHAKETALQHSLRLPNSSSFGEDGMVQISIAGRAAAAGRHPSSNPTSPGKQQGIEFLGTAAYNNPLAFQGHSATTGNSSSPTGSPHKAGRPGASAATAAADVMFGNPLAYLGEDVEVGQTLAPPMPPLKADRALQRVAQGAGHKASAASKWLSRRRIDPNDPRNAMLLELLRAREAAAHSGQAVGAAGIFRLDLPGGLSLGVDRVADRRVAFIKQRWTAGPYHNSSSAAASYVGLQGARQLRVTAPLSAKDTLDLQDTHREALALIEAASMGVGGFVGALGATALSSAAAGAPNVGSKGSRAATMPAAGVIARHERALKWSQGVLARALETRQASLRSFALRLRTGASKLEGGRMGGRFKTDDVVKDAPLPEFKFDLSTLAAAFAPVRPLRPQRRIVKKIQAAVPRDTQLVITVQRASNLPHRIAAGGGGIRAQSPNRMSGVRLSSDRFAARNTNGGSMSGGADGISRSQAAAGSRGSVAGRMFPAGRGSTRDMQELGAFGSDAADDSIAAGMGRDGDDGEGGSSLSCFVEVQFRGRRQRTTAVDSNVPIWNEQLLFPVLGIDQEASPRGLRDSDSAITINIFDEVVTPTAAMKAMRAVARASGGEGGVLPERERRFLGCVRMSLAALYQAEVVDGSFKLDVPPVLLGYVADNGRPASLALYLTLKPRLAPPAADPPDENFTPGEQGDVNRHARKWVSGISGLSQCKARVVQAMAVDPEGVATLLPRYLAPTPLPPVLAQAAEQALGTKSDGVSSSGSGTEPAAGDSGSGSVGGGIVLQDSASSALDQLMLAAARWVAALPYMGHSWLLGRQQSKAWASSADVVGMAAGGQEEHAHLLAGYFMQLGLQAFVVLGTSLCGAQAAFVLTNGQPLSAATTGSAAAVAASTAPADAEAATNPAADEPAETDDVAAQHQRLRQRLAAAAAAAQARQRVTAAAAAAAQAGNPALEAAAAAEAAGVMHPPNVARLRLWDPLSGHCVPVRDPACELREVGTVYNSSNIWANIQDSGRPWDISWHLGDSAAWKPFFGPVLPPRELASIQVAPSYSDLEGRFYEELEASAEEAVRDALYEARSVVVTQPNNKLSRVLKAMLKELPGQMRAINAAGLASSLALSDTVAAVAGPAAADAAREELQRRLQLVRALQLSHNDRVSREMRGCLINGHVLAVPFSDNYADAVAEAVINSGVHRTVDPRVKFAMAAYVERLGAAFVACIWIYVAAIRETS